MNVESNIPNRGAVVRINLADKEVNDIMLRLADYPAASKLFWFIVNHMEEHNALLASYTVFQEALNMSRPTVSRGLATLRELELLTVKKSGGSNLYLLNPSLVWKSWNNGNKYCELMVKVLLTESEQET